MEKALLLTIGTEITCGEVVNTNASWLSARIEEFGPRVVGHLTVRDHRDEIRDALDWCARAELVFITGGLGPTSDDLTRECVAAHAGVSLEFDASVWSSMEKIYRERGLPLREAHKHQCHFPAGSERLENRAGTAHGFLVKVGGRTLFAMPGPPRELEDVFNRSVAPWLSARFGSVAGGWIRWTCLGAPESEIAELVEPVIRGADAEVGYRAQVPYVRVKIFARGDQERALAARIDKALAPYIVGRGDEDLARELIERWPVDEVIIDDQLTGVILGRRLFDARSEVAGRGRAVPRLRLHANGPDLDDAHLRLLRRGEEFVAQINLDGSSESEVKRLPYKIDLSSERGLRSAVEWSLHSWVTALRAKSRHLAT